MKHIKTFLKGSLFLGIIISSACLIGLLIRLCITTPSIGFSILGLLCIPIVYFLGWYWEMQDE